MKIDRREVIAALAPAIALAAWSGLLAGLLWLTLDDALRRDWLALLGERIALVGMAVFVVSIALGAVARRLYARHVAAPAQLAEQVQSLAAGDGQRELDVGDNAGLRALAAAIDRLARQRGELREAMEARVREASRDIEQEKTRLAALMAELTQSVVVCNLDGRILLYNRRARLQFRALSDVPAPAAGAELIGIGRSIYAVLERQLVAHALENLARRLQRGEPNPSTQFVTHTRGGQLLRVQLAAVRTVTEAGGGSSQLAGFVLMLDNITREFADETARDQLLHRFTETARASIGSLQAAVELLDEPELDAATRQRLQGVVRDEAAAMSVRIRELAQHTTRTSKTRWPLEEMHGADLVAAAQRRIEARYGCRMAALEVDAALWLEVDSFSLLQALAFLSGRLVEEYGVKLLQLRLQAAGERAQLDLVWPGQAMSTETITAWETEPMRVGDESSALTVRDVIERHGGGFWFERDRTRQQAFFRFLLPLAAAGAAADASLGVHSESRPEFYDFDLFGSAGAAGELAQMRLADLSYTVFDTETTGLDPGAGDEILQIGATRIVAGKLRRQEVFEQLVDPQRTIPEAGIPIHGIRPEMVAGQPTIDAVLPAFHAFAHDTVLVAHNAAFDMRFLQLKEAATGVRFTQPVLDTLLLSAVAQPAQPSHSLEAIAERLGVPVLGRHTALGDAMVTAEVFLKLIALLEQQGVQTLGQALEAAQKTYYARISY